MGSQVRILYRPPSKEQVRDVKSLAFFLFDTKGDTKIESKNLNAFLADLSCADVIARFA